MKEDSRNLHELVRSSLPNVDGYQWREERTEEDEVAWFLENNGTDVLVKVSDQVVCVMRWYARWDGPSELKPAPISVGEIDLSRGRSNLSSDAIEEALYHLVEAAKLLRRSEYVECQFCGNPTPPEHQYDDEDTCHSCASSEYGVVY